jgi:hypothetical protein
MEDFRLNQIDIKYIAHTFELVAVRAGKKKFLIVIGLFISGLSR